MSEKQITGPDALGHFGMYGGSYIPETLVPAARELTEKYLELRDDRVFQDELWYYLRYFVGRPTPLFFAQRLTDRRAGDRRARRLQKKLGYDYVVPGRD